MSQSTTPAAGGKPSKPHPDFPLYAHASGRWAKKVRGKTHFFGPWRDPGKALERWLDEKDDLLAGRTPRKHKDAGPTVADVCSAFLEFKEGLVESRELAPRSFRRYYSNCELVVKAFGKERPVEHLRPDDFQGLRKVMTSRWGPVAVANEIQMVRSVFKYAYESGLIDKPVRFGPGFRKPSAKTIRQARTKNGPRLFEPKQIKAALKHATPNMKAMILLGLNAGLGNTDLALLPIAAIDLESGWLDHPRPKTAMPRRVPLWTETVAAIRAALKNRPEPKDPADAHLLFIGPRGQSYTGGHRGYRVHQEARRVFDKADVSGRTFYDLRRTFQTIAEGAHDLVAVQSIMGHAPASGDMSAIYRQRVEDDRLRATTDHVHTWLFGKKSTE